MTNATSLIYLKTFTFFICFWLLFFLRFLFQFRPSFLEFCSIFRGVLIFFLVFKYSILSGNQTLHRLDHRLNSDSESGFANLQSVLSPICVQSGFFGGFATLYRFFFGNKILVQWDVKHDRLQLVNKFGISVSIWFSCIFFSMSCSTNTVE